MKRIAITWIFLLAFGCATPERKESSPVPQSVTPRIDFLALQHDLGMAVSPNWVGYREKRFDACRFATDLPNISDCSRAHFIQIGIQLSCRPRDEGDNSILDPGDLTPIGNRELRWQLGEASGHFRTDLEGFGLILEITSVSMKKQGLRISTGEDYLLIRAGQATQIVTPVSWCK
jgi:hypothetical protein